MKGSWAWDVEVRSVVVPPPTSTSFPCIIIYRARKPLELPFFFRGRSGYEGLSCFDGCKECFKLILKTLAGDPYAMANFIYLLQDPIWLWANPWRCWRQRANKTGFVPGIPQLKEAISPGSLQTSCKSDPINGPSSKEDAHLAFSLCTSWLLFCSAIFVD